MKWIGVPDGDRLYPAVGGADDITEALDHWEETHTGAIVIDLLDNDKA